MRYNMSIEHVIDYKYEERLVNLTPMKAIRFNCLDCCGWSPLEVRECKIVKCPLHPYRMGKRQQDDEEEV